LWLLQRSIGSTIFGKRWLDVVGVKDEEDALVSHLLELVVGRFVTVLDGIGAVIDRSLCMLGDMGRIGNALDTSGGVCVISCAVVVIPCTG
jgi:hypothetical protein